jgi:hypothetical protein
VEGVVSHCKTGGKSCREYDCGPVGCRAADVPQAYGAKATNPKDAIAGDKVPLGLCPDTLIVAVAMAFVEGGLKYGKSNWTIAGAKASVYMDALDRHVKAWKGGEELDPDTGLPHLWKAAACLAILIDCTVRGNLVDDRPPSVDLAGMMRDLSPKVKELVGRYGDRNPRHYTIADTPKRDGA